MQGEDAIKSLLRNIRRSIEYQERKERNVKNERLREKENQRQQR
jgi:hypothetical protein